MMEYNGPASAANPRIATTAQRIAKPVPIAHLDIHFLVMVVVLHVGRRTVMHVPTILTHALHVRRDIG